MAPISYWYGTMHSRIGMASIHISMTPIPIGMAPIPYWYGTNHVLVWHQSCISMAPIHINTGPSSYWYGANSILLWRHCHIGMGRLSQYGLHCGILPSSYTPVFISKSICPLSLSLTVTTSIDWILGHPRSGTAPLIPQVASCNYMSLPGSALHHIPYKVCYIPI